MIYTYIPFNGDLLEETKVNREYNRNKIFGISTCKVKKVQINKKILKRNIIKIRKVCQK